MKKNPNYEFFESKLHDWLKENRKGQFVLIKDKKPYGFYNSFEDALKNAYEKFGMDGFIIQEITDEKRVNYINSAFLISKAA